MLDSFGDGTIALYSRPSGMFNLYYLCLEVGMKITVLVENTTVSSEYKPKHGLCLYIETANHKILFDLGSDRLFFENAKLLDIDIGAIDTVIISHGHTDHGGALKLFLDKNNIAKIYVQDTAFEKYYAKVLGVPFYAGLDASLKENNRIIFNKNKLTIDDELFLFSDVTNRECYSTSNNALFAKKNGKYVLDDFKHEQNLIINEKNNIVLFAGCAHNGIINIQKKAESILDKELTHVISGFHLYNPISNKQESKEMIREVGSILQKSHANFYTCHCTGKKAYDILKDVMGEKVNYLSTGTVFEI